MQLSGLEGVLQRREKNSTEVAREHPDRQEESGSAGNPATAVARKPPTRDHAVQMGMMDERLAPGVEDGEEADLGAEVAGVGRYGAERLGDGPEEETVDDGLVLGGDLGDRRGHGEDDVEVLGGKQVRPAPFEPRGAGQRLTCRTVAVATGVVPDAPMTAVVTLLDVAAELMHPLILQHQITPKTSRYTRCSMSMLPNVSINTNPIFGPIGEMVVQHQPLPKQRMRPPLHRVRLQPAVITDALASRTQQRQNGDRQRADQQQTVPPVRARNMHRRESHPEAHVLDVPNARLNPPALAVVPNQDPRRDCRFAGHQAPRFVHLRILYPAVYEPGRDDYDGEAVAIERDGHGRLRSIEEAFAVARGYEAAAQVRNATPGGR